MVRKVAIFFSFPLVVWMLSISLKSEESYSLLSSLFQSSAILKIMIYLFLVGFSYHLLAGLKKLLSDAFGIGETLESGRILSWVVFGATFLLAILFIFPLKFLAPRSYFGKTKEQLIQLMQDTLNEFPTHSDQKLSDILHERGVSMKRRTVTKYRHELGVETRFKRAGASEN